MDNILSDLSAPSLVSAIEDNLFAFVPAFQKWPRAEVHLDAEIMWCMTGIPMPLFNSVMRARFSPERVDSTIASITAQAGSRQVPLLWWTGPQTQPADLGEHLERHGFVGGDPIPGMAIDLEQLKEPARMASGLTVGRVSDDETLRQWSRACADGFEISPPGDEIFAEAFYDFMRHMDSNAVRAYLGSLGGKPVATSLMVLGAGVAGIYNVATIPEARRQGIGAVVTAFPLQEARREGYRIGILHASDMGAGVYRSLGFQQYCTIAQYVWRPEGGRETG